MTETTAQAAQDAEIPPGFEPMRNQVGFSSYVGPMYVRMPRDDKPLAFGFRADQRHVNQGGVVHGGMMVTFVDHVLGGMVYHAAGRKPCSTVSLDCNFVAPGRMGQWIEASGEVVRATRSLVFMNGHVRCEGRTLLQAKGVWKVLDKWLGESNL